MIPNTPNIIQTEINVNKILSMSNNDYANAALILSNHLILYISFIGLKCPKNKHTLIIGFYLYASIKKENK